MPALRKRRKKSTHEEVLWGVIQDYATTWIYTDHPSRWSASSSRALGFGSGWCTSLRNRKTSCAISSVVSVCEHLNKSKPPSAPSITAASAFLAAERRLGDTHISLVAIPLSIAHQVELSRAARKEGKPFDTYVKEILLNHATKGMLHDEES